MTQHKLITIGIDASNIRRGGGLTHLMELLRAADPRELGIGRVVIWGGKSNLGFIGDVPWLDKRNPRALDKGLIHRTIWQAFCLSHAARNEGCDVLFVPGGSYAGNYYPVVTMSQNLLPFEDTERRRYGLTLFSFKLIMLRYTQSRTFKKADGVIFLTDYARDVVFSVTGMLSGQTCTIAHGLNQRFYNAPKSQRSISEYDFAHPYRILYVSIVDLYKHQWHVVEAVTNLRKMGLPVILELVGPAYRPALKRLNDIITRLDNEHACVHYLGAVEFAELENYYKNADLGLFASSCENLPNILLETMASGLPIACSNRGPMPSVLGSAGKYFDPEKPDEIVTALLELIESPALRANLAQAGHLAAQKYSWEQCANETFQFFAKIKEQHEGTIDV
jgi:glycosyltransferase involved in cell wall biosynthesis